MDKERIVVLGAKGMLGTEVVKYLSARGLNVAGWDLPEFDITNEKQLGDVIKGADIIVNCAAFTNVDAAESDIETAYKVNSEALEILGRIAFEHNIYVVHISTDFVFDGKKAEPYCEDDEPRPLNVYGKSKLAGEHMLTDSACDNCIIRVEWTYGVNGDNFIKKLIGLAERRDVLKVVDDQFGSPTATAEIAKVIFELAQRRETGLFHYAADGYASRYDIARFVFEKLGIETTLMRCGSSEFKAAAVRPLNSRFCCDKIKAVLGGVIENWQGPLGRFLEEL